jgi:putative NADH-flavin reductase
MNRANVIDGSVPAAKVGGRMKIVVLGATGGTGLELIKLALERNHSVTAFVRSPERLNGFDGSIEVIKGDLLSRSELESAIKGHDVVLSAFGPREDRGRVWRQSAVALAEAMERSGVRRVVALSVAFLFKDSILPPAFILGRLFFRDIVNNAAQMEEVFINSDLDWTIVRPSRLTDKRYTGRYRVREGHLPNLGLTVSRADVADYMIKTVEKGSAIRKVVGVCN